MNTEIDYDGLMLISEGHAAFQVLWAAVELGVFKALSEQPGMTREQIAARLELQEQPIRILMVGLASLGLVRKEGGKFFNAALTEQRLVGDKPGSLTPVLGWQHYIVYPGLIDFVEAMKTGTNIGLRHFPGEGDRLYQRLVSQPKIEKVFQDAMSALSHQANTQLVESLDLHKVTHLMDVGGGDATNAIRFAHKFPHLKVTVFDSPSVCEIAKENIAKQRMQNRVDTTAGDLFTTPYPSDIDAIIYCHMFTIWSPEENQRILMKTYEALPEGGMAIVFNMMGNDDDTGPISTALGSLYFLTIATGKGMLYSWRDYEIWMRSAGFSEVKELKDCQWIMVCLSA